MISRILTILIIAFFISQCSSPADNNNHVKDSFGIYLLKDSTITTSKANSYQIEMLEVQDNPIINLVDIRSYDWANHTIDLKPEAFDRFKKIEQRMISTDGLPFIVIVDAERIYLGNIYPCYSSCMHVNLPYIIIAPFLEMKINRAPLDEIEDIRNDARILRKLMNENKLK